jgi:hypothetical protein
VHSPPGEGTDLHVVLPVTAVDHALAGVAP